MEMTTVETLTLARFGKALFNTSFFTPNGQSLLGMTRQALLSAKNNCRFFPASTFANLNFEHQLDSGPGDGSRNNTDSEAKSVTAPPGRKNPK